MGSLPFATVDERALTALAQRVAAPTVAVPEPTDGSCAALINAVGYKEKTDATSVINRYGAVGGGMVVFAIVIAVAGLLGWEYWVLAIETTLIALFAIFWVIQTKELWHEGLR